jgi:hypothetical protein
MFATDMLIAALIAFALSFYLLRRGTKPMFALAIAIAVGVLLGWEIVNILPVDQTSASIILSTDRQLSIIWYATHDIAALARASRYFYYMIVGMDVLGSAFGFIAAQWLQKRLRKN